MSTNKTPNYNLHSWLPQDEFHVSEINENFTGLDTELAALDASLNAEAATRAQQMAKKAELVLGTYIGPGSDFTLHINLGFRPRAVFAARYGGGLSSGSLEFYHAFIFDGQTNSGILIDDTGFTARSYNTSRMALKDGTFNYAALR